MKYIKLLIFSILFFSFNGCEKESTTKLAKVHWDRDMCTRCVMVVSDRHNTIQVINPKNAKKYMFDDIGCMALWFYEEKIVWEDKAIIWITDVNDGKWIDARTAFYDTQNVTPMSYGFSAHKNKDNIKQDQEIIDYKTVLKRVRKIAQ